MRRLWLALALLVSTCPLELGIGLWSHSLSLLADVGHLASDVAALGLALVAGWFAQRPASGRATFGYQRVEILVALVNGLGLVAIALTIGFQAIERFQSPQPVLSFPLLLGAILGLIVNTCSISLLHQHSQDDLNVRGALLHVIADTAGSLGVLTAAVLIGSLHWLWADAAVSLLISCLVGLSALPLIWNSLEVLMNYAPRSLNPAEIAAALQSFSAVYRVEKLRVWAIASNQVALCAHLIIHPCSAQERDRLLLQLQHHLNQSFGIQESTLQLTSRTVTDFSLYPLLSNDLIAAVCPSPDRG
jgi:cobalt-zinc-cadmium efflux system protein